MSSMLDRKALAAGAKEVIAAILQSHALIVENNTALIDKWTKFENFDYDNAISYYVLRKHKMGEFLYEYEKEVIFHGRNYPHKLRVSKSHQLPTSMKSMSSEVCAMAKSRIRYLKKEVMIARRSINIWRTLDIDSDFQLKPLANLFSKGHIRDVQNFESKLIRPWLELEFEAEIELEGENFQLSGQNVEKFVQTLLESVAVGDYDRNEKERVDKQFKRLCNKLRMKNDYLKNIFKMNDDLVGDGVRHEINSENVLHIFKKNPTEQKTYAEVLLKCGPTETKPVVDEQKTQKNKIFEEETTKDVSTVAAELFVSLKDSKGNEKKFKEKWQLAKKVIKRPVSQEKKDRAFELLTIMNTPIKENTDPDSEDSSVEVDSIAEPEAVKKMHQAKTKKERKQMKKEKKLRIKQEKLNKKKMDLELINKAVREDGEKEDDRLEEIFYQHVDEYREKFKTIPPEIANQLAKKFAEKRVEELEEELHNLEMSDENRNTVDGKGSEQWELDFLRETRRIYLDALNFFSNWDQELVVQLCFLLSIRKDEEFDWHEAQFIGEPQ